MAIAGAAGDVGQATVRTGSAGSQAASAGSQAARMAELSARSLGTINPAAFRGVGEATTGARGLDDAAGAARGARRADDAADATRGARRADDAGDAGDAQKSSFLEENASTLLAGGIAAGGIYYLDQQYKEEKEAVKDCMKVCLPDNWDDHAYGDLEKSELKYKEIADAGEQPLCTAEIEDCGQYCGDKCKEIHDFDAPGSGLAEGLAGDLGEGLGGVFKSIFGGLFEGMGLDTSVVGYASSASSSMICMVLMIMLLK